MSLAALAFMLVAGGCGSPSSSMTSAAPASRWRTTELGVSDAQNTSTWSGDLVAWDYSDENGCGVEAYDIARGQSRQLETDSSAENGATDSFWYRGRVFWLRRGSRQIVSAAPTGGAVAQVLSRPGISDITRLISAGDRVVWMERAASKWSLASMKLPRGTVERVARISDEYLSDVVLSDRMLAWIETGQDGQDPEPAISVLTVDANGALAKKAIRVPTSPRPADAYTSMSLAVSGDRLVWTASDATGTLSVYTWRTGDSGPTRLVVPPPLEARQTASAPVVSGDLVACLAEDASGLQSVVVWRSGDASATVLPGAAGAWLQGPVVSGDRVAWTETATGTPGGGSQVLGDFVAIWSAYAGSIERVVPSRLNGGHVDWLRMDAGHLTFTSQVPDETYSYLYILEPE